MIADGAHRGSGSESVACSALVADGFFRFIAGARLIAGILADRRTEPAHPCDAQAERLPPVETVLRIGRASRFELFFMQVAEETVMFAKPAMIETRR